MSLVATTLVREIALSLRHAWSYEPLPSWCKDLKVLEAIMICRQAERSEEDLFPQAKWHFAYSAKRDLTSYTSGSGTITVVVRFDKKRKETSVRLEARRPRYATKPGTVVPEIWSQRQVEGGQLVATFDGHHIESEGIDLEDEYTLYALSTLSHVATASPPLARAFEYELEKGEEMEDEVESWDETMKEANQDWVKKVEAHRAFAIAQNWKVSKLVS